MPLSRRSFLEEALVTGAFTGLLPLAEIARAAEKAGSRATPPLSQGQLTVQDPSEFWNDFYDAADPSAPKKRGGGKLPADERQVEFFHKGPVGLRYVYDVSEEELLDHPGDVQVSIVLGQFRPGSGDQNFLKNVKTAQLRVDCAQTKPMMDILSPLAWCAMASLKTDQAGKLPSLKQLGFDSPDAMSGVTKILLPRGTGKLAVNVYSTKGDSFLQRILKEAVQIGGAVAPILNFPAISVPALKTFQAVYSKLEEQASFLMNSHLTRAVATKQALADPDREETFLHLLSGDYVLIPKAHLDQFKTQMDQLEVRQGYLVRKDASPSEDLEARANQVLPDVTYATLRMTVAPATGGSGGPSSGEGDGGEGGSGGGGKGGAKPKPASGAKPQVKEGAAPAPCGPGSGEGTKKKPSS